MKNLYFDIAATTPVDKSVNTLMFEIQKNLWGNPSSIHKFGQDSYCIIEKSRIQLSKLINCKSEEIIFTGCGTESNNIILNGLLQSGDHVITSSYEHPAVKDTLKNLSDLNVETSFLKPKKDGLISLNDIESAITKQTKLISIMFVNNELGSLNEISKISKIAKTHNILFHTDAVQALGKIDIDIKKINFDFASFSAHKLYGPKGVGAIYIKNGLKIKPSIFGGGQENYLRPGTPNISGIAGFGLACEIANNLIKKTTLKILELEQHFINQLDKYKLNYSIISKKRVPGIIAITFNDILGENLLLKLDLHGIAVSFGAACSSGTLTHSSSLDEIGLPNSESIKTIRISFGKFHSKNDINYLSKTINDIILDEKK